jgi:hypothetical protein
MLITYSKGYFGFNTVAIHLRPKNFSYAGQKILNIYKS